MRRSTSWIVAGVAAVALLGGGYHVWQGRAGPARTAGAGAGASAAGPGASAPPISVTTVTTQRRDWPVQLAANGVVTSLNTVDVRPQISNVITQVHIKEGQFVRAGEPLFSLDSRNDEANLAKAQAQVQKDEASLADAERQLARSRDLLRQNLIAQSAVDTTLTNVESQKAVVSASRAALAAARVAAGYNRINAPTAGRAGAIVVFPGSYVQPSGAPLVTITQLDPIAVSFTLPQRNLNDALAGLREGNVPVQAQLPDGRTRLEGRLQFVDNVVDAASGSVKVKAVFANPNLLLWPGAYVNVQLRVQTLKDAIVVPQAAVVQGATDKSVFVVGPGNKAVQRKVELLASGGSEAVVSGLDAGERVIVEGKQNLRPGSAVRERLAEAAGGLGGAGSRRGAGASGASGAAPMSAASQQQASAPQP